MIPKRRSGLAAELIVTAAVLIILAGCACFGWYRSGVQAEVYRREGIEITTWEVFMGAHPAERKVVP